MSKAPSKASKRGGPSSRMLNILAKLDRLPSPHNKPVRMGHRGRSCFHSVWFSRLRPTGGQLIGSLHKICYGFIQPSMRADALEPSRATKSTSGTLWRNCVATSPPPPPTVFTSVGRKVVTFRHETLSLNFNKVTCKLQASSQQHCRQRDWQNNATNAAALPADDVCLCRGPFVVRRVQ